MTCSLEARCRPASSNDREGFFSELEAADNEEISFVGSSATFYVVDESKLGNVARPGFQGIITSIFSVEVDDQGIVRRAFDSLDVI